MPQASQGERPGLQNLHWYRTMRDNEPVWRDPKTGLWNVFRYEDVTAVLADYRTFSSDFSQFFPEQAELIEGNIVATDPPLPPSASAPGQPGFHAPGYRPPTRAYRRAHRRAAGSG